jgi:hypothetical protein
LVAAHPHRSRVFKTHLVGRAKACVQCRACQSAEGRIPPAGQSYEFVGLNNPG